MNQEGMRERFRVAIARSVEQARVRLHPLQQGSLLREADLVVDELVQLSSQSRNQFGISIDNLTS